MSRLLLVLCASSEMQTIFFRVLSSPNSSANFWIVVRYTPPLAVFASKLFNCSRLSISITELSPINFLEFRNCWDSWSSKSERSVISTTVGECRLGSCMISRVKNSIIKDLPQPVVPKYVPPFPSPRGFWWVRTFDSSFLAAKYCG